MSEIKSRVLLIDDARSEDDENVMRRVDLIARNYWEGMKALIYMGPWDVLLIDHDLNSFSDDGKKEFTGYDIMCELEQWAPHLLPKKIICVSSNPPGRVRIETVIKKLAKETK